MPHGKKLTDLDVVGREVGRLLVLGLAPRRGARVYCLCLCACGEMKEILWATLQQRRTQSCGCLTAETLSARRLTHGVTTSAGTEGEKRAFTAWVSMRDRCRNPKNKRYHVYGGRGIGISPDWERFSQFLADMGPCPDGYSLEREKNDEGYSERNCHWLPRAKQAQNRQDTIRIRYMGQDWCFKRLCEYLGRPYLKTYKRYVTRGWDLARALDLNEKDKNDLARIE